MSLSIIILAAGQGTRMRSDLPKVLQPLAGKPMLSHVISCSKAVRADDICVVYGYGGDLVRAAIDEPGLRWALQAEQLGTGHAVMQAMPETPDANQVLILFGDGPLLWPQTLANLVATCGNEGAAVLTVDREDPFGYGRIIRENGQVVKNVEEKDATDAEKSIKEIHTGVFCCPAAKLKDWLSRLSIDNSQGEYYLTDVIGMAVADGLTVMGLKADSWEEVMGINDKQQLAQAERALQLRRAEELMQQGVGLADPARLDIRGTLTCGKDVFIDVNAIFEGAVHLGDNVRIESNNLIRDSNIGDGTVVHSNCHIEGATTGPNCEIGPFARLRPGAELADTVKVGNYVEIKKSTVASGSKVNHLTYIGDSTIGEKVNVGAGTITCNYDGATKHRTTIGDGAFIGSGVELVAPVDVGAGAFIGAGSTITKSAPSNTLTVQRSKQIVIENWKAPRKKT